MTRLNRRVSTGLVYGNAPYGGHYFRMTVTTGYGPAYDFIQFYPADVL